MYNASFNNFVACMLKTGEKNFKGQFYGKPKRVLEIKKKFFFGHILSWPVSEKAIFRNILVKGSL